MNDDFDIEDVLRASLAEHARQAPPAEPLAERIVDETDHPRRVHDLRGSRRWRGWMLPAVAAASVVAVVAAIIGLVQLKHSDKHTAADRSPQRSARTTSTPTGTGTGTGSNGVYATAPSTASASGTTVGLPGGAPIPHFRVIDLTFIDPNTGWALGSGTCLTSGVGVCPAVMRTDDGGQNWVSTPNPPANLPIAGTACTTPCVTQLRFANADVGYAFGPDALFMTTDGGASWTPKNLGPASSLEVAHGTALRVDGDQLLTAKVGSESWTPATLPKDAKVADPVVRAMDDAYVLAASRDSFYASTDNGREWTPQPAPCPGDLILSMNAGADGSLVVLCVSPKAKVDSTLYVSGDGGQHFDPVAGTILENAGQTFGAANSSTVFRASPGLLERSTDGGRSWHKVASDKTAGEQSFLGFQNETTGRWVTGDGSRIYATTDGGQTWDYYYFK